MIEKVGFKIRGFPDQKPEDIPSIQPTIATEEQEPPKKTRGPYKKKLTSEQEQAQKLATMTPMDKVLYALKDTKGAPDANQLNEWKAIHGNFYMSSVDGTTIYIWKTLKRTEYKNMMASGATNNTFTLEEYVVRRCLLWPKASPEFLAGSDAGVVTTLFKQIQWQSGFISDEESIRMIEKI